MILLDSIANYKFCIHIKLNPNPPQGEGIKKLHFYTDFYISVTKWAILSI